jgi:PhnB protein
MSAPGEALRRAARTSIVPQLSVRGGRAAIDFYKAAFGAVEEYRVGAPTTMRRFAQLSVGGAPFWVADESPAHANHSPESLGGATTRMLLIVEDPQATLRRQWPRALPRSTR